MIKSHDLHSSYEWVCFHKSALRTTHTHRIFKEFLSLHVSQKPEPVCFFSFLRLSRLNVGNIYSFFLAPWSWCGSLRPLPAARLATSCWWEGMGNVGWKVCGPCQQEEVKGSRSRLGHRAERKALRDSSLRKDTCQEQPVKRQGYDIS